MGITAILTNVIFAVFSIAATLYIVKEGGIDMKKGQIFFRSKHPLYLTWKMMIRRCNYPAATKYAIYGARGIKVCTRWSNFWNFLEDMGPKPIGTTLDRIDPNGDYEPSNCRWATYAEQNYNLRLRKNNTSGHKGVSYNPKLGRWRSYITVLGKQISGGYYDTFDEAVLSRKELEKNI